ncbi:MAG: hypothetical protein IJ746_03440 [Ruminococcus sp.]|nr:hypothetical protein [Ruminococcus sp.]
MKRTLAIIAAFVLCLGIITSCGDSNGNSDSTDSVSYSSERNDTSGENSTSIEDSKELEHANQAAKLVFVTVETAAMDCIMNSMSDKVVPGFYEFNVTTASAEEDRILSAVLSALKDNSDSEGEFCYQLEEGGKVSFAQFRIKEGSYIGQYPDPNSNTDANLKWGTFTSGKDLAKNTPGERLEGAEALKNANTIAKLVYISAQSRLAELIADANISTDYKGEHMLDLESNPSNELEKLVIQDVKEKDDTKGEIFFVIDDNYNLQYAEYRDSYKTYVGKYPTPNTDITKDIEWGETDVKEASPSNTDEGSSSDSEEGGVVEGDRYIVSSLTPAEVFKALSFRNTDEVIWEHPSNTDEGLTSGNDGVYMFVPKDMTGKSVAIKMQNNKCVSLYCEISIWKLYRENPDDLTSEVIYIDQTDIAYKIFKDFIYAIFPDFTTEELDKAISDVIGWAESIKPSGASISEQFYIGSQLIDITYKARNGEQYNGFICNIKMG